MCLFCHYDTHILEVSSVHDHLESVDSLSIVLMYSARPTRTHFLAILQSDLIFQLFDPEMLSGVDIVLRR